MLDFVSHPPLRVLVLACGVPLSLFPATAQTVKTTPTSLSFGNQVQGTPSSVKKVTLSNGQGTAISISSMSSTPSDFSQTNNCPATLSAGKSCTISIAFNPTALGTRSGTLSVQDTAGDSPQIVALSGTGVTAVTATPPSFSFGNEAIGKKSPAGSVTVKNNQSKALTISSIATNLADYTFTHTCPLAPLTLGAGATCKISVYFTPTRDGLRSGTLTIADDASFSPTVSLAGVGVVPALISPASVTFASQTMGSTGPAQAVTLTNNQSSSLTISSIVTSATDFLVTSNCPLSPATLVGGASCVASVSFSPKAIGSRTGTLRFKDNANNSPQTATLSGVGTAVALASIAITPANSSIALGTTRQLNATGTYTDGSTLDLTNTVTWNTANHAIATVSSQGVAASAGVGSTSVTATSGSVTGSTTLNVTAAVLVSIAVTPAIPSIPLGTSQQFTATGTFTDGTTQDVTKTAQWGSDTPAVAAVSNATNTQGLGTSVGTGSARITASSGSISGSTTLTVTAAVLSSIAVAPANPSIALGTKQQFSATGTFTDGSTQDLTSTVTWASDTVSTASVNKTGLAQSAATGTAAISATSGIVTGSTILSVTAAALVSITIDPQSSAVPLGKTQQFTATGTYTDGTTQDLTQTGHWASTTATVATISNSAPTDGLASTLATGTTTIGITSGSVSASTTFIVNAAVLGSISITPNTPTIPLGTSQQFTANGTYSDGTTHDVTSIVAWNSSPATVAIISNSSNSNGLATSSAIGAANISAASGPISSSTTLTVAPAAVVSIAVTPAAASVPLGFIQQFTAVATYTDGSTADITQTGNWSSTVPGVATISSSGIASTLSTGGATIGVASASVIGSATLTVNPPVPVSLAIAPLNPTIYFGSAQQFTSVATYSNGASADVTNSASWNSSNPAIAAINSPGQATGLGAGSATVSALWGSSSLSATTTLTVSPLSVTITPASASLSLAGTQQFSASVTGSGNQGIIWSLNGPGTLTSAGLYTAPALCTNTSQTATVTATSAASSSFSNSASVTTNSSSCSPISVSLSPPSATIASGGTMVFTPIVGNDPNNSGVTWSYTPALGSLGNETPTSATLNAANVSSSTMGTLTATSVTDPTKTASAAITVTPQQVSQCGPPLYKCSRTDLACAQVPGAPAGGCGPTPAALPNVGGLLGANTVITDPDFNNPIVRVSDASLNPANRNISVTMSTGGSGDENMWNSDSTLFTIGDTGSNAYPMTFDPVTMQAARMYVSNFPATGGLKLANSGSWSFADSNVLFTFDNQFIHRFDFTDRSNPPTNGSNPNCGQAGSGTLCTFYDFTSSPNCLGAGYKVTWLSDGGQSKFPPDLIFAAGFSNAGVQNTGFNIAAYKVGSGCSSLNTKTGMVTGDWGATGNVGISDQFTIHNVKISRDGNWLVVTQAAKGCLTTCNTTGVYFWQIGTTNLVSCISRCTGHWTEGTNHFVNGNGTPFGERAIRAFAAADNVTLLIPADCPSCFPAGYTPPNDAHIGWSNADENDTTPFGQIGQSTTYDGLSKLFPSAWYNEVQAIAVDGSGKVWRFAHTFTSAKSLRFDVAESIGSISQDGRFFMWTSDWMGTLGSENGSSQCTLGGTNGGTGCRGDVFVVKMQ